MIFLKQKTSKDSAVFSYEDNFSPTQGYSSTDKDPVLAYDYVEEKQEQIQDIGGFSLVPASVGNNSVFKASITASIGPSLAVVTVWRDLFSTFSTFKFVLEEGINEIALFTDEAIDQVDVSFDSLGNIVGGFEDNFYQVFAGISSGGFLV